MFVMLKAESSIARLGWIAICSRGDRGLITSDKPSLITYPDGRTGYAYTGVQLGPAHIGEPWSGRDPVFVRQVSRLSFNVMMSMIGRAQRQKNIPVTEVVPLVPETLVLTTSV